MPYDPMFLSKIKRLKGFLAPLVLILLAKPALSDGTASQTSETLTVSITAPAYWCPYACRADGSQWGFAIEIARAALESAGYNVVYQNRPYDRALLETGRGRTDAVAPTFKDEAEGFIFPDHALSITEYCFYVPQDNPWRFTGTESLEGVSLLVTSGYSYGETMDGYIDENLGKSVTPIMGEDVPDRLRDLIRLGRFDAFIDDRLLFESGRNSSGLANAGCLQELHPGYLALSPEHPERSGRIAEAFDRGFQILHDDGTLCDILEKYELNADFVPGLEPENCSQRQ